MALKLKQQFMYTPKCAEMTEKAVANLMDVYSRDVFAMVQSVRGYSEQANAICKFIKGAFRAAAFGYYKGQVHFFTGKIYEPVPTFVLRDIVSQFLDQLEISPRLLLKYGDNKFFFEAQRACCYNPLQPSFHLMSFRNCVVDMATVTQYPHDPRYHCVYLHDYDFDMTAECPTWKAFLKKMLPDKASRQILQMYLSLALVDRSTMTMKVESCLCCYGTGSNGKSVVFETVCGLFGKENIGMSGVESIICGKGDEQLRAAAAIDGMRLLYCSEVNKKLAVGDSGSLFKKFVSGEPIQGRLIGQDEYTIYNIPYLVMNLNDRIDTGDNSYAITRRFIELDFPVRITEEDKDMGLAGKIAKEYPGVMAWLVRGMRNFKANNYRFPQSRATEMAKFKNLAYSDSFYAWCSLMLMRDQPLLKREEPKKYAVADLFASYVAFCELNGLDYQNLLAFGRKMVKAGFTSRRENKTTNYIIYGDFDITRVPELADKEVFDMPAVEEEEELY
jgi:P4 family phage/plasmid primase-like protien